MSLAPLLKELEAARSRVTQLEKRLVQELASQPKRFGFDDPDELAEAIRHAVRVTELKEREARSAARRRSQPPPSPERPPAENPGPSPAPATPESPAAAPVEQPAPSAAAAAPAALPTGTSLDDPKNFGVLPDFALVDHPGEEASSDRERLISALQFAKRVVQTSRVPAAVWREWRRFEQNAAAALRQAGAVRID